MKTAIASTSLAAYKHIEPTLAEREKDVIRWLSKCNGTPTRNELAEASGIRLSSIAGRVNRLVKIGIVHELPARKDRYTGRVARPLQLAIQQELFA